MARGNGGGGGGGFKADDIAVERELPCKLTDDELRVRGDAMAEAELAIDQLKADRRALNKKISERVEVRNKLAHVIDSESEPRLTVCKWIARFDQNVYVLVRQDTGDIVEQRPMSAADRQGALPYAGDADGGEERPPGDAPDDDAELPSHPDDDPLVGPPPPDEDATPVRRPRGRPRKVASPRTRTSRPRKRG